jgi:BASS family bile acid:Na+ symporter
MSQPDLDFIAIMLVIVIALCLCTFGSGFLVAWICQSSRDDKASLVFGLGMNNNGAGLTLASMGLADHPEVMLPIILYNLLQHFVASLFNLFISRRQPEQESSPPVG